MRRFTPLRPDPRAVLARANPVAKLAAATFLMAVLFVASGIAIPTVILVALLASLTLTGLTPRDVLARTWLLLAAALSVGVMNVLLAPGGSGSLLGGVALGLRLLGIALCGVLAIATTDPTDLADALQQQARLAPRLAVGVLAAVRMLPILAVEWQILGMARRARGVSPGLSPVRAARIGFGMLLAVLVSAIRRATRLATAMEARGFGAATCRTIARPQRMRPADWLLLLVAALLGTLAVVIGLAL